MVGEFKGGYDVKVVFSSKESISFSVTDDILQFSKNIVNEVKWVTIVDNDENPKLMIKKGSIDFVLFTKR